MSCNPPFQPIEFNRVGVTFADDEGYVSYGDSSCTEISILPWDEAVKVFAVWWNQKRDYLMNHHPDPDVRELAKATIDHWNSGNAEMPAVRNRVLH